MAITTTTSSFPVLDITFRSDRMQGDWGEDLTHKSEGTFVQDPPTSTTLESVIKYFKNKTSTNTDEQRVYTATAGYLEELRTLRQENRHKEEEKTDEYVNDIDTDVQQV